MTHPARYISSKMMLLKGKSFTSYILRFSMIAVALSVCIMVIATSVISGFKKEISNKMFDFWGHVIITNSSADREFDLAPMNEVSFLQAELSNIEKIANYQRPSLQSDRLETINLNNGVDQVYKFSVISGIIKRKSEFEGILLRGVDPDFNIDKIQKYIVEGTDIQFRENETSRDLVLSRLTAERINLEIGDNAIIYFIIDGKSVKRKFTLSGIYNSGLGEFDKSFGFIDHRWMIDLLQWEEDQSAGLAVYIDDINDMEILKEYINVEKLPHHLMAETIKTRASELFEWLELQNLNEKIILALMSLVAVVNMITGFFILTIERTKMIGLLKSIGATDWTIRQIFLHGAGILLLKGILIGIFCGVFLCIIQKWSGIIKLSEKDYYLSAVPIDIQPFTLLVIALSSFTITLACLILPSTLISKISPIKALQFK